MIPYSFPFHEFGKVHQYATIPAGQRGRVFYFKVPETCVAFISEIASNWYQDTHLVWVIDGETVDSKIERMLGPLQDPHRIDPPYVAKDYIEFKAHNNDDHDHEFEVICNGVLYHKQTVTGPAKAIGRY